MITIMDETEQRATVTAKQRAYDVPRDVADELQTLRAVVAAFRTALELIRDSNKFNGGTWKGELQGIASAALANSDQRKAAA